MSSLLQKLKQKASVAISNTELTVIQVPSDAKTFVCKNHFTIDPKGKKVTIRTILSFLPNEKQQTCSCGIVYKKV